MITYENTVNLVRRAKLLRTITFFLTILHGLCKWQFGEKIPGERVHMASNLKRSGASRQKIANLPLIIFLKKDTEEVFKRNVTRNELRRYI